MISEFSRGARMSALVALAKEMLSIGNHGLIGRTHLQKAVFFLQQHLDVPFGYQFRIYQYGPYSSQLDTDLHELLSGEALTLSLPNGYPDYNLGPNAALFLDYFARDDAARYSQKFTKLASVILPRRTRDLELLTTISFLRSQGLEGDNLVGQVHRLKPHFRESDVKQGVETLNAILRQLAEA